MRAATLDSLSSAPANRRRGEPNFAVFIHVFSFNISNRLGTPKPSTKTRRDECSKGNRSC